MKLLFAGDINFRGYDRMERKQCEDILCEVISYFQKADFRIVNLETPLADKQKHEPIKKSGPNLIADPQCVVFLNTLGVDVATLANNHTGDYGEGAVEDTLQCLTENGIRYCGAGKDIDSAYGACRLEKSGCSVSVISVCENEFGMATPTAYGSAGYNARLLLRRIKQEKQISDFVVVVFHGGNEFNPLPSPDTQDRYRFICDMGADAVIAGHTHCPQGYEVYDGKPIVYSMGNFFFQSKEACLPNDPWYYGYMVELTFEKAACSVRVIPYKLDLSVPQITVFEHADQERMLAYIERLSSVIADEELLEKYFRGWSYLHPWIPQAPQDYSDLAGYNGAGHYNLICCESHYSQAKKVLELCFREGIKEAREEWSEKIKDLARMPV